MKNIVIVAAVALGASQSYAEEAYNADFVAELRGLDLGQEAFQYALTWAGTGEPKAEIEVIYSLIEGRGIKADPLAAMQFACGPRTMDDFFVQKALIVGNLRLSGTGAEVVRCPNISGN